MIVYVITFGLHIEPFLRTIFETDAMAYFNGIPTHSCSTNPVVIRAEIDVLRTDYNNRFKQVVFTSLLNAYYAAFIPCCFAQSFLYYDLYWATQHLGFLILGGFTMCTMFCFPANYCDVMHMASLHLGKWIRIESRSYAPPTVIWTKTGIWPTGQFVKHSGELFKSYGIVTTAIPGNGIHIRFYVCIVQCTDCNWALWERLTNCLPFLFSDVLPESIEYLPSFIDSSVDHRYITSHHIVHGCGMAQYHLVELLSFGQLPYAISHCTRLFRHTPHVFSIIIFVIIIVFNEPFAIVNGVISSTSTFIHVNIVSGVKESSILNWMWINWISSGNVRLTGLVLCVCVCMPKCTSISHHLK